MWGWGEGKKGAVLGYLPLSFHSEHQLGNSRTHGNPSATTFWLWAPSSAVGSAIFFQGPLCPDPKEEYGGDRMIMPDAVAMLQQGYGSGLICTNCMGELHLSISHAVLQGPGERSLKDCILVLDLTLNVYQWASLLASLVLTYEQSERLEQRNIFKHGPRHVTHTPFLQMTSGFSSMHGPQRGNPKHSFDQSFLNVRHSNAW